jgi:ribokinase
VISDDAPRGAAVVVVGSLNVDLAMAVRSLPHPGETVISTDTVIVNGGKGANQAVAAARLGGSVRMIGRVGRDEHGSTLLRDLAQEGVDTTGVRIDPDAQTGLAVVAVDDQGENLILVVPGANARVDATDLDAVRGTLRSGSVVVAQLEVPITVVRDAMSAGRAAGALTILNTAPVQPAVVIEPLARLADVLVLNAIEAATLDSVDDPDPTRRAARLHERYAATVIITLGSRGVVFHEQSGGGRIDAFPVVAEDSTGAGDAFVAAVAVALGEGRTVRDAALFGAAAGALAATRRGAQPSLPRRDEVLTLLESAPGREP